MTFKIRICSFFLMALVLSTACNTGSFRFLKSASPHEIYQQKLRKSGLAETGMGKSWIALSEDILSRPVEIEIPYLEKGYFSGEKVQAVAFSFKMKRGQKLQVRLNQKPVEGFMIFTNVWTLADSGELSELAYADSLGEYMQVEIDKSGTYILRLQPELLSGGEYSLEINSAPLLAYPLLKYKSNQIRSFWGDGRDANTRKHEGIDIFSSFRTPVIASASGTVRVNENKLGGKVVWLRAKGKPFSLYYAHLDEQTVADGQAVQLGDTLGRMGNSGNARSTPPHLHFGIYTKTGAVDPLPFVDPKIESVKLVKSDIGSLNTIMRTNASFNFPLQGIDRPKVLPSGTIVFVRAATENKFRVELPDGGEAYIPETRLSPTKKPLANQKIQTLDLPVFDRPDSSAPIKSKITAGETVKVLGRFGDFELIESSNNGIGWIKN